MQDQRREVEAGEGAEGRGGARNEIGLADRADDAAQCGVGRFHIGLFRSGGFRRNVLLHLIEHCNCRHSAADPERAAVTAQPAEATMMQAIAIHCVVLSRSPRMRKPASAAEIGRASCRERVCQYVSISVVAVSLKTKTETI